ncbi:MAG: CBS domain-containing protein [Minwuia sp.]|uniref:CBS domain-containing protein n=1 Tax=Minwuia sp. TaxID=2493630 RepID=UPI003A8912CA
MLVSSMLRAKGGSVGTIRPDTDVLHLCDKLKELRVGALVVSEDGERIQGIVSERDVVRALATRGAAALDCGVTEIMSGDVVTCSPSDNIGDLMRMMTENRVRHLPVTEGGRMVGLVSIGDVVKYRVEELESDAQALQEYIQTG